LLRTRVVGFSLSGRTALVVLAACGGAAAVALGVQACLPDLPGVKAQQAEAGPGGFCGDGYVDLDRGEECDPGPGAIDGGSGGCTSGCMMDCTDGQLVWDQNNHCYFTSGTSPALEPNCTGLNHVVTFASESEYDEVKQFFAFGDGGETPFWVGLTSSQRYAAIIDYEPGWAPSCSGCYAHTDDARAPLPPFDLGFDSGRLENCVAAVPDASSWQAYPCSGMPRTRVICEREPIGTQTKQCDAGFCIDLVITHKTKRYVYQPASVTAPQAVKNCAAIGGRLLVLDSRDEREQLWRQLSLLDAPPTAVWLGLTVLDAGGPDAAATWVWDDGTVLDDSPDAHPAPWGDPHGFATFGRAYLAYVQQARDNTLAHDDGYGLAKGQLPSAVCEVAP
jgi:hypothetical protein